MTEVWFGFGYNWKTNKRAAILFWEALDVDVFAHALWTTASALVARRASKRRIHLLWAGVWGVLPDLAAFTVPAAVRIWRVLTGQSSSLLPDGRGPQFNWVWDLYNATHSVLVFAIVFGGDWLVLRMPVLEMLGWALHILIDVFTHSGRFAIQFLWPLWAVHVDGVRWEAGWVLVTNYTALASFYLLLWFCGLLEAFASSAMTALDRVKAKCSGQ